MKKFFLLFLFRISLSAMAEHPTDNPNNLPIAVHSQPPARTLTINEHQTSDEIVVPAQDWLTPEPWLETCFPSNLSSYSAERTALRAAACLFWPLSLAAGCALGCFEGAVRSGPAECRNQCKTTKKSIRELKEEGLGLCARHAKSCCDTISPCVAFCYSPCTNGCYYGTECLEEFCAEACCWDCFMP